MPSWAVFVAQAGLLALSAFFSAAETALFSMSSLKLRQLSGAAAVADRRVAMLMLSPRSVLVTILLGNMVVNVLASAIASDVAIRATGSTGAGVLVATVLMTFLILVLGEIAPKTLGYRYPEILARIAAAPLLALGRVSAPVRWILLRATDVVLGAERRADDRIDLAEAQAMVRVAHAEGEVEAHERDLVLGVFELGSSPVGDVMTPRTEIFSIPAGTNVAEAQSRARKASFSKIPIARGGPDELIGFVTAVDLIRAAPDALVEALARRAEWVPEVKPALELLEEFRATGARIAFVVDEHGHLSGLITLTDLLEEVSGEMIERGDLPKVVYERLAGNRVAVPGRMEIRFFNEQFGTALESEASETLAGLVLERLGRIPSAGESTVIDGIAMRVARVEPNRIVTLEVDLPPAGARPAGAGA
jgi:CBS domain containing-hemolysin-like protein